MSQAHPADHVPSVQGRRPETWGARYGGFSSQSDPDPAQGRRSLAVSQLLSGLVLLDELSVPFPLRALRLCTAASLALIAPRQHLRRECAAQFSLSGSAQNRRDSF